MILDGVDVSFDAQLRELRAAHDVMGMSLALCLREFEADIHSHGEWDQPARVLVAYRELDLDPNMLPGQLIAMGFTFRAIDAPLYGDDADIAAAISTVAGKLLDYPGVMPDNVFAWCLLNEGYAAFGAGAGDPAVQAGINAAARSRQLYRHPAAQEIRMIIAVDRADVCMSINRVRDTDELLLFRDHSGPGVGGDIPDALHAMMRASITDPPTQPPPAEEQR